MTCDHGITLVKVVETCAECKVVVEQRQDEAPALRAQRDEAIAALRDIVKWPREGTLMFTGKHAEAAVTIARAVLARLTDPQEDSE